MTQQDWLFLAIGGAFLAGYFIACILVNLYRARQFRDVQRRLWVLENGKLQSILDADDGEMLP